MADIKTRFTIEGEQQYRSAMTDAANAVKVLNAQEKLAKAQFQQTGNAEKYAAQQADILRQKITQQKTAVAAAEKALKQLSDNGVAKNSRQFQQWQTKLVNAQTSLAKMETELNKVTSTMDGTTSAAEKTGDAVGSIGKKVSFDAVIGGIGKITGAMQAAAGAAIDLGKELGGALLNAASWADDLATDALVYGRSWDELQRMTAAAWKFDTSVEAIAKSQQKLENAMYKNSEYFKELNVSIADVVDTGFGLATGPFRNVDDVFWDVGNALMHYGDAVERDNIAQALFGRSWRDLLPLFEKGRAEYEAFKDSQSTVSDDTINNLTELDDAWQQLQYDWNVLKMTVLGEMAPSFTTLSNAAGGLLKQFNEYLGTDEGKEKMQALGEAVTALFDGITDADFGAAMDTAKGAIEGLTSGLKWIKSNWALVSAGLKVLAGAFGALKIADGVLTFVQLMASGKFLLSGGGAAAAGAAAGTSWGTAFYEKALAALGPLAAFLITLGTPAPTGDSIGNNDLFDENGKPTYEMLWNWQQKWKGRDFSLHSGSGDSSAGIVYTLSDEQRAALEARNRQIAADRPALDQVSSLLGMAFSDTNSAAIGALFDDLAERYKLAFQDLENEPVIEGLINNMDDQTGEELSGLLEKILSGEDVDPQTMIDFAGKIQDELKRVLRRTPLEAETEPEMMPGSREMLQSELNSYGLTLPVSPLFQLGGGEHANGLPLVPWDGYPAILHKGERVLTAQQNRNYTANSNTYFEHVTVNNGMDADALAGRIAAAQQRAMSGFGS